MATSVIQSGSMSRITITRTENPYFDAKAMNRVYAYKSGGYGVLKLNLVPSASIPAGQTAFFEIGRISPPPKFESLMCVPNQTNASVLTVQVKADGAILALNGSSTASDVAFYRGMIPLIY